MIARGGWKCVVACSVIVYEKVNRTLGEGKAVRREKEAAQLYIYLITGPFEGVLPYFPLYSKASKDFLYIRQHRTQPLSHVSRYFILGQCLSAVYVRTSSGR